MSSPKLMLREQIQFVECITCEDCSYCCDFTDCYSCQEKVCPKCQFFSGDECFCEPCFDELEENIICLQD